MYERIRRELVEEGESLLTDSQLFFLDEVKEALVKKVAETDPLYLENEEDQNAEVLQEISALETNLMTIIRFLRRAKISKLRFVRMYPIWKEMREECIGKLTEIANSINSDRFSIKLKLAGHSAASVGGVMVLTSAVLVPFSFGIVTPLFVAGVSLALGGPCLNIAATAISHTSVTENPLLRRKANEAKHLLQDDKRSFEDLCEWINHASELQEAMQSVLLIPALKDVTDSIKDFVLNATQIVDDSERQSVIERYIIEMFEKFLPLFKRLNVQIPSIASILTALVAIFLLLINTDNRVVVDFASLTVRSILLGSSTVEDLMDIISLPSIIPRSFSEEVTRGAVAVVEATLDKIGTALASGDISSGSLIREAKEISDAVKKMKDVAEVLARICDDSEMYNNLSR